MRHLTDDLRVVIEAAEKWADYLDGNDQDDEAEAITVAIQAVKGRN